jgi:hypothetical protein
MRRFPLAVAVGVAFLLVFTAAAAASPPTISYSISGIAGSNGWYRGSADGDFVTVHWSTSGADKTNCLTVQQIAGPTTGSTATCWAQNADGTTTATTRQLKIDDTPPTGLTASFSRKPDYNGWYNHPVTINWHGTDATSGIAACSSMTYQGAANAAATVNGSCTDMAGNRANASARLAYDATPPVLGGVEERSTPAADLLQWTSTSASDRVVVRRAARGAKAQAIVFNGSAGKFTDTGIRPGAQYLYSVQSFDQAGNASNVVSIAGLPKILTLRKVPFVPRAAPTPILRWQRVRGAAYYNVQLFRGSKRIYSAWPTMHQIGLQAAWKWSGHRFRLTPGRYHWYVWAGFGARKSARYRPVGNARFVIPNP